MSCRTATSCSSASTSERPHFPPDGCGGTGAIHTDFERGFIRAETIAYDDFIACNGETGAREKGKLRSEGKDYVVQDGDVMLFRFNV